MDILQWLNGTDGGRFIFTMLVSMIPVVELRGGIPFGVALGLGHWEALLAAIIGNMIPLPFIVVYIRHVFRWMRRAFPRLDRLLDALERKAHLKGNALSKYQYLGLCIFVAIPLPGTGGWTGALAAAFLDMRLRDAIPALFLGVAIAGFAVSAITFGVSFFF